MLDLNPETIEQIVERAHQYQTREQMQPESDDDAPDLSEYVSEAAGSATDPLYEELRSAIDDLEPDQQVSLVALMWLGRGDFVPEDWSQCLARAGESWNDRTSEYLLHTPLLADYLTVGLDAVREIDD